MTSCSRIILLILGILIFPHVSVSAPVHQWSQSFGDSLVDEGAAVAVDASGNVLVTGFFSGTVDFGGGSLVSAGGREIFLAKYDGNGAHVWSQRFRGNRADS